MVETAEEYLQELHFSELLPESKPTTVTTKEYTRR
jgi:hypothetical protein